MISARLHRVMEQSPGFLAGGEDLAKSVEAGIRFCKEKHHILQCPPKPASAPHRSVLIRKWNGRLESTQIVALCRCSQPPRVPL
jgi:hypothetical protein